MQIKTTDLTNTKVIALLEDHFNHMSEISPPASSHVFSLDKIIETELSLWCAWDDSNIMGCGGLKEIDFFHGEIKSMRTHPNYLRKGVGQASINKN